MLPPASRPARFAATEANNLVSVLYEILDDGQADLPVGPSGDARVAVAVGEIDQARGQLHGDRPADHSVGHLLLRVLRGGFPVAGDEREAELPGVLAELNETLLGDADLGERR